MQEKIKSSTQTGRLLVINGKNQSAQFYVEVEKILLDCGWKRVKSDAEKKRLFFKNSIRNKDNANAMVFSLNERVALLKSPKTLVMLESIQGSILKKFEEINKSYYLRVFNHSFEDVVEILIKDGWSKISRKELRSKYSRRYKIFMQKDKIQIGIRNMTVWKGNCYTTHIGILIIKH